ncbi:energy-coupling factor ABC transporter substrate-binding protein [Anaerocolumna sedimenticola]|uniref:Cobalt transport protein CbiN n=1 Tax=Anaerocolumna sedimenticola TaxID=2696063 RepID=A0A6P1TJE6_9FIRM|nr:energy-coupling factor ABC transporter substrate-binding protein [Anaerocolumna sedimenticola]QHQ61244.1 energy-coupling factor ABC transporter substrate-binding protein [Anaerocolumna sedimenticola]
MTGKMKTGIVLLLICILIAVIPLAVIKDSDFGGSDDAAGKTISEILNVDEYKPWVSPVFEPPGGETESLLFCLQAALGAGVFGYGIGVLKERNRNRKESKPE